MFGQGLDFGSITNVGEPLVTSFTSTSTVVNSSLTSVLGFGYNVNDGYLYTLENTTPGNDPRPLVKRNALTGAYISTGGNFTSSVTGTNLQNFAIDSDGYFWFMFRNSSASKVRKYDFNGNYQNVEHTIVPYYGDGVAIDTSKTPNVIYGTRNNSNTIYRINTNGVSQGAISIQNGTNSDQIMYCNPSVMMRVYSQGSYAGNMYKFNIDTNQSLGSFPAYDIKHYAGGAYNPVDKIAWFVNYGTNNQIRKFTANF
tara:strand:+ start:221 stop:985 length:765 start_codon:yes stop_codon:yes gene_type:complete